jgi:hypothetical protein
MHGDEATNGIESSSPRFSVGRRRHGDEPDRPAGVVQATRSSCRPRTADAPEKTSPRAGASSPPHFNA